MFKVMAEGDGSSPMFKVMAEVRVRHLCSR